MRSVCWMIEGVGESTSSYVLFERVVCNGDAQNGLSEILASSCDSRILLQAVGRAHGYIGAIASALD